MADMSKDRRDKEKRRRQAIEEAESTKEVDSPNKKELRHITFHEDKIFLNLYYTKMKKKMEMEKINKISSCQEEDRR